MPDEEIGILGAAILFHDSVYDVSRTYYRDNEIHSAEYAKRALSSRGIGAQKTDRIYRLVRDTAHASENKPENESSELLHDFDMAVLGSSPERYALYVADIVTEFGVYPGREFAKGRLELLEKWIADDNLFLTEYGKEKFLARARENMRNEADGLRNLA